MQALAKVPVANRISLPGPEPRGIHRAVSLETLAPSCRGGLKLSTSLYVTPGAG